MAEHLWANIIREGARDDEALLVMRAINDLTGARKANRGSVMVVCAQILAQCITQAPREVASEVRQGIMTLIDGYAIQTAVGEEAERGS